MTIDSALEIRSPQFPTGNGVPEFSFDALSTRFDALLSMRFEGLN